MSKKTVRGILNKLPYDAFQLLDEENEMDFEEYHVLISQAIKDIASVFDEKEIENIIGSIVTLDFQTKESIAEAIMEYIRGKL